MVRLQFTKTCSFILFNSHAFSYNGRKLIYLSVLYRSVEPGNPKQMNEEIKMDSEQSNMSKWWKQKHLKDKMILIAFAAACLLIVIHFNVVASVIGVLGRAIRPVIYGLFVAFILNLPTNFFERIILKRWRTARGFKVRRVISFLIALTIMIGVITIILFLIIPQVAESIQVFIQVFPEFYDSVIERIEALTESNPEIFEQIQEMLPDVNTILNQLSANLSEWTSNAFNIVSGVIESTVSAVFAFVFGVYAVLGKHRLKRQGIRLLNWILDKPKRDKLYALTRVTMRTFSNFAFGQLLEAIILGSLCTVGMLIFRFPYATMIGSFVGLMSFIPLIGAFLGGSFGVIMIATQDPFRAVLFVVFLICIQQLEGDLIYPKVVGDKIGLPAIWVLVAVMLGGSLYGIAGILLSVPVFATIYKLLTFKTLESEGKIDHWLHDAHAEVLNEVSGGKITGARIRSEDVEEAIKDSEEADETKLASKNKEDESAEAADK